MTWERTFLMVVTGTFCLLSIIVNQQGFGTTESSQEDLEECDPELEQNCNVDTNQSSTTAKETSQIIESQTSQSDENAAESTTTPPKIYNIFVGIGYPKWITNYDLNDPKPELYSKENEIVMVAYVQGKKIELTDKAYPFVGPGNAYNVDGAGSVAVDVSERTPLSIMIFAYEADGCPHYQFPDDIHDRVVKDFKPLTAFGHLDPLHPLQYIHLQKIASELNGKINSLCGEGQDEHEVLNPINLVYQPIHRSERGTLEKWGAGHFFVYNMNAKGRYDFSVDLCIYPTPYYQIPYSPTCSVYNEEPPNLRDQNFPK